MSILKTITTLIAPEAVVPANILASILRWRPSLSEIVIFLLVIFCLVQTFRIEGFHIKPHLGGVGFTLVDVDGYKENVADLKNQLEQKTALELQSHEAQITENKIPHDTSQAIAENINEQSSEVSSKIASAVQAYADANPVHDCGSLRGTYSPSIHPSTASVREPISTTPSSDKTNVVPGMVSIPTSDLDHYIENTSDLIELREYLKLLIDEGDAVPYTDKAPLNTNTMPAGNTYLPLPSEPSGNIYTSQK